MDYFVKEKFDISDLKQKHEDKIIQYYFDNIHKSPGCNVHYPDQEFNDTLAIRFKNFIHKNFIVGPNTNEIKTWIYVQNNERYCKGRWHDHIRTATINAVLYINPQSGLTYYYYGEHTIEARENEILAFPYWLSHKPDLQSSSDWRISINLEYYCMQRPIVRETGMVW